MSVLNLGAMSALNLGAMSALNLGAMLELKYMLIVCPILIYHQQQNCIFIWQKQVINIHYHNSSIFDNI